jgi:hypothetical protein
MATAAKSRIVVAIRALQMKSTQMPPAKTTGLTLPELAFSHLEEKWQCQF